MKKILSAIARGVDVITPEIAVEILISGKKYVPEILSAANSLREKTFGNNISICQIMNIKSGNCSEDCSFCAQSRCATQNSEITSLASISDIHENLARIRPETQYVGLVTSGRGLSMSEVNIVGKAVQKAPQSVKYCASLGILTYEKFRVLQKSGLYRYHHNLETSEAFFPTICRTHTWRERWNALLLAKKTGLSICSGGIFGIGESYEDRVQLAFSLQEIGVDAIPINFLTPIAGTPLSDMSPMNPLDMLLTVAMFRLVHPMADIRIAGGRKQLGEAQLFLGMAGISGWMIGDLLTTQGPDISSDVQFLSQLGYRLSPQ